MHVLVYFVWISTAVMIFSVSYIICEGPKLDGVRMGGRGNVHS
jgi:hypothetical protein